MPYRVINIYCSVTCYTNHINSTRIQSIASSIALMVFPDVSYANQGLKAQYPGFLMMTSLVLQTIMSVLM